jgi:hypothetical protein
MSQPQDLFRQYAEDVKALGQTFRDRGFDYEKAALDFAHSGFRTLSYLNGGGLVAIPTVVAFFKADLANARRQVIFAGAAFIAGLIMVVIAQICAFFVMAKRSEVQEHLLHEQMHLAAGRMYPTQSTQNIERVQKSQQQWQLSEEKRVSSNRWRLVGLSLFAISAVFFIVGCIFGARAILSQP